MERNGLRGLRVVEDVRAADWIVESVDDFDRHVVGSLVPGGFDGHARLFHPAYLFGPAHTAHPADPVHPANVSHPVVVPHPADTPHLAHLDETEVRWDTIAAANQRQAHAGMQWSGVSGSRPFPGDAAQPGLWDEEPEAGSLPAAQAGRLRAVLSRFTSAEECFYATWDGFGALTVPVDGPRVEMPARPMVLLRGPLADAAEVSMEDWPWQQSPSLWWPADRAWCVATDVDLNTTYVAASRDGIEALVREPGLEVWAVDRDQSLTGDSDAVNALISR